MSGRECPICMDEQDEWARCPHCQNAVCWGCSTTWHTGRSTCMFCRQRVGLLEKLRWRNGALVPFERESRASRLVQLAQNFANAQRLVDSVNEGIRALVNEINEGIHELSNPVGIAQVDVQTGANSTSETESQSVSELSRTDSSFVEGAVSISSFGSADISEVSDSASSGSTAPREPTPAASTGSSAGGDDEEAKSSGGESRTKRSREQEEEGDEPASKRSREA